MKIVKTASGKRTIKISKSEWKSIGEKHGWMKEAADPITAVPITEESQPGEAFKDAMPTRMKVEFMKAIRGTGVAKLKEMGILEKFFASLDTLPIAKTKALLDEMGNHAELTDGIEGMEITDPELYNILEQNELGPTHPDNPEADGTG